MTQNELDTIEQAFKDAGRKCGGLMETFFYRDVPKLIRALREGAIEERRQPTGRRPLPAVSTRKKVKASA